MGSNVQEKLDQLKAQRNTLDKQIAILEAEGGEVAVFVQALDDSGESSLRPREAAEVIVRWEKYQKDGTLPGA